MSSGKQTNKQTGSEGEQLAIRYLIQKGYSLLDTNWQFHHLELDIVAQKDGCLVIVEVKTRTSVEFGEPQNWVTRRKQLNLIHAANAYILSHHLHCDTRFDIIGIYLDAGKPQITHIPDAFSAVG